MSEAEKTLSDSLIESARQFALAHEELNVLIESLTKVESRASTLQTALEDMAQIRTAMLEVSSRMSNLADSGDRFHGEFGKLLDGLNRSQYSSLVDKLDGHIAVFSTFTEENNSNINAVTVELRNLASRFATAQAESAASFAQLEKRHNALLAGQTKLTTIGWVVLVCAVLEIVLVVALNVP